MLEDKDHSAKQLRDKLNACVSRSLSVPAPAHENNIETSIEARSDVDSSDQIIPSSGSTKVEKYGTKGVESQRA